MKKLIIVLVLIIGITYDTKCQEYKFISHTICNLNTIGDEINCKEFSGTNTLESITVYHNKQIDFSFVKNPDKFTDKWDKSRIITNSVGYNYTLLNAQSKSDGTNITLFFDKEDNLYLVFIGMMVDKIPITIKLNPKSLL